MHRAPLAGVRALDNFICRWCHRAPRSGMEFEPWALRVSRSVPCSSSLLSPLWSSGWHSPT